MRLTVTLALLLALAPAARADADPAVAGKAMAALDKACSQCHVAGKRKDFDAKQYKTLMGKNRKGKPYVAPGDPGKSLAWEKIDGGEMPPEEAKVQLADADKAAIKAWIEGGAPQPLASTVPVKALNADNKEAAKQAMAILDKHCTRCHGASKLSGDLDVRDPATFRLKSSSEVAYVSASEPAKSYLWKRIENDSMPDDPVKLSAGEKAVVKSWIEAGAPAYVEEEKPRPPVAFRDVMLAIRDHMRSRDDEDQPYQRYFTLVQEHNDPRLKESDLRSYRAALAKSINSLSWKRGIVQPVPIDKYATVYAIDLRDLDWDKKYGEKYDRWDEMLRYYPYGLNHGEHDDNTIAQAARDVGKMSSRKLVYVRADWFCATATRPPLYHTILRLPTHAGELEKKLGVDILANFKRGRLWRAGFVNSGVSNQNRLVERHDALYGAYWKSYDFKPDSKKANLLHFPLGPEFADSAYYGKGSKEAAKNPYKEFAFDHDGGEMIFHLPNGLLGYYLVDGKDKRIDAGPLDVVEDKLKTSGSPAIVTGLSCMTCHAVGMIHSNKDVWDEIRDGTSIGGLGRTKVRRLYPVHETVMKPKLIEDSEQYLAAAAKTTDPYLVSRENKEKALAREGEPVGRWARKYRLVNPGLDDLAYELGMTPPELLGAIKGSSKLRELGMATLLRKGGVVSRADWESLKGYSLYQQVAQELSLGDSWIPVPRAAPGDLP